MLKSFATEVSYCFPSSNLFLNNHRKGQKWRHLKSQGILQKSLSITHLPHQQHKGNGFSRKLDHVCFNPLSQWFNKTHLLCLTHMTPVQMRTNSALNMVCAQEPIHQLDEYACWCLCMGVACTGKHLPSLREKWRKNISVPSSFQFTVLEVKGYESKSWAALLPLFQQKQNRKMLAPPNYSNGPKKRKVERKQVDWATPAGTRAV